MKKIIILLFLLFTTSIVVANNPLINPEELEKKLGDKNLVIIDILPANIYKKAHIPGAINSSYRVWRVRGMLPDAEYLQKLIRSYGIDKDKQIVLVSLGQNAGGTAAVARIYWTLKVAGLDNISILNGGFFSWMQKYPKKIEQNKHKATASSYIVGLNENYIVKKEDMLAAIKDNVFMIDSRSPEEYLGLYPPPATERAGRIKNAINLNYSFLTKNGSGLLHNKENLKKIYKNFNISLDEKQISYCHTGHRTALQWFVTSEILGNKQAYLYDGSMTEWSKDKNLPLENPLAIY
jgi:thiosulfate/3-mercaptopyruvate sulfurtransferase